MLLLLSIAYAAGVAGNGERSSLYGTEIEKPIVQLVFVLYDSLAYCPMPYAGVGDDIFVDGFSERSCLFRPFATSAANDDWKHCPPRPCRTGNTSNAVDEVFFR